LLNCYRVRDFNLMVGSSIGNFYYFENTGTSSVPVYDRAQTNPFGIADIGSNTAPTLADLDGDGDLDLMAGQYSGRFYYFENTGTSSAPMYAVVQTHPFGLADIGSNTAPTLADLDGDGDLDLMAGETDGDFYYFKNNCLPTTATISPTAICSYTSPSGNYTWAMSGNYMDTIPNTAGCDSLLTINLTINPVDATTSTAGLDITANQTGATYQWLDCNNGNAAITGATNATYTATANGNYAVLVTVESCSETSACVNVIITGIDKLNQSDVTIFPNPITNQFTIDVENEADDVAVTIVSIEGKIVYNIDLLGNNKMVIDASTWNNGIYFVQIRSNTTLKTIKLIKQ
ncbi:MAG: T9SS type A sorting domain-containing protein, partial [Cyclobacteriaceae bacterium]|nr:T9SS type A sorting domain-containing protein [Cyclobacteriaceae bacterium]